MRLYKRADFLPLPAGTIYSRVDRLKGELMNGLFCKTSAADYGPDWVQQDLIAEGMALDYLTEGSDIFDFVTGMRDTFQEFETDLQCGGRDGMFDDEDVFVVWNKNDVQKLITYLLEVLPVQRDATPVMQSHRV